MLQCCGHLRRLALSYDESFCLDELKKMHVGNAEETEQAINAVSFSIRSTDDRLNRLTDAHIDHMFDHYAYLQRQVPNRA
jgi:hypothetical protein